MSGAERIEHVLVWSGWLRLGHWLMALGVGFQVVSAWLINHAYVDLEFWRDWHVIVGQGLALVVTGRVVMLFLPGSGNWRSLAPPLRPMLQMVKFYLSFARLPLPNWYAHNPLWAPVYALMLIGLVLVLVTGFAYHQPYRLAGFALSRIHEWAASLVAGLALAHVLAVMLHDWKGRGAFISAMLSGYRYFHVSTPVRNASGTVTLDALKAQRSGEPR